MFGHITLGCDDWERAKPFWLAVMDVLGHPLFMETDTGAAFGEANGQKTFIGSAFNGEPAAPGNGVHIAYLAGNRTTVDAFYTAALANGGTDEGRPSGPIIIPVITAPMSAIPTATSSRPPVTAPKDDAAQQHNA